MEFTKLMIRELVEYSLITAFIKDDEFAEFTVKEISKTSWGQEVMFSEYWRADEYHETMFEKDNSGFMSYYGTPFTPKVDEVDFLDKLVIIDFTLMGFVKCKTIVNVDNNEIRLIIDGREVLNHEEIDKERIYINKLN